MFLRGLTLGLAECGSRVARGGGVVDNHVLGARPLARGAWPGSSREGGRAQEGMWHTHPTLGKHPTCTATSVHK